MKALPKFLALLFLVAFAATSQAAHVRFDFSDFSANTNAFTNAAVKITPLSTPRFNGLIAITSDRLTYLTDSNATLTVSNMVYGNYTVAVRGPFTETSFQILVPDTNVLVNAAEIVSMTISSPSATSGYTQAAADARFLRGVTNFPAGSGTNILSGTTAAGVAFLKALLPGIGMAFDVSPSNITLNASSQAGGETNTASNVDGVGIFKRKSGVDFEFKGLNGSQFETNTTTASIKAGAVFTNSTVFPFWTNEVALTVKGAPLQESNIFQVTSSDGTRYFEIGSNGWMRASGGFWSGPIVMTGSATNWGLTLRVLSTASRNSLLTQGAGSLIYNINTGTLEFYNGSTWRVVPRADFPTLTAGFDGHIMTFDGTSFVWTNRNSIAIAGSIISSNQVAVYPTNGSTANPLAVYATNGAVALAVSPDGISIFWSNVVLGASSAGLRQVGGGLHLIGVAGADAITNSPAKWTIVSDSNISATFDEAGVQTPGTLTLSGLVSKSILGTDGSGNVIDNSSITNGFATTNTVANATNGAALTAAAYTDAAIAGLSPVNTNLLTIVSNLIFRVYPLTAHSQVTNFVADFAKREQTNYATAAVHFVHSTNRPSLEKGKIELRMKTGPTNVPVSFHSSWKCVDGGVSPSLLPSNTVVRFWLESIPGMGEPGIEFMCGMEGTNAMGDAAIIAFANSAAAAASLAATNGQWAGVLSASNALYTAKVDATNAQWSAVLGASNSLHTAMESGGGNHLTNFWRYVATSNVVSITTPTIPLGYHNLRVNVFGRGTNAVATEVFNYRVNGQSGMIYYGQSVAGVITTTSSAFAVGSSGLGGIFTGTNDMPSVATSSQIVIPEYGNATFGKVAQVQYSYLTRTNAPDGRLVFLGCTIDHVNPITNLTLFSTGAWVTGTVFNVTLTK